MARKQERARLDVYVNKIVGDEPHLARVRDISTSGVFMYKLLEPEVACADGSVALELKLPGMDDIIWALGEVVRAEENRGVEGVAVRFTRLADADRRLIQSYVAQAKQSWAVGAQAPQARAA
jgi:hypothetical protein